MDADLAFLALAVATACIERPRSPEAVRWQLRHAWALTIGLGQTVVTVAAAWSRGLSTSSVTMVAVTLLLLGGGLVVLVNVRTDPPVGATPRKLYLQKPLFRVPSNEDALRRLSRTLFVMTAVMALWVLVPLRYAGTLGPFLNAVATVESLGQFAPLRQESALAKGQCIEDNHQPAPRNTEVPCTHPHVAEVVAEVYPTTPCPERSAYGFPGLNLEVVRVGNTPGYRGLEFCVIRSVDADFRLNQRVANLALTS